MTGYQGPSTVSQRTVGMVMRLLNRQGKPMTISQLSAITGKSYNTVKRALSMGGAVQVEGSYPKVFTTPDQYEPERVVGDSYEVVRVPYVDHHPVVARWNGAREQFAANLARIEITANTDPDKLARDFAAAATTLASIAYAVGEAKRGPDWFAVLGGLTDESQ